MKEKSDQLIYIPVSPATTLLVKLSQNSQMQNYSALYSSERVK